MKRALILGAAGQDGTLLRARLAGLGYEVTGVDRDSGVDITRAGDVEALVAGSAPDEIYHLAAHHASSETGDALDAAAFERAYEVNFFSLLHVLEAMRGRAPRARLFYACSSHVFDGDLAGTQDERTPMDPRSAYAMTKADGRRACGLYRDRFGLHASVGILYPHESPLRPAGFLSRRVVDGALAIAAGGQAQLRVGDLAAVVDWGWAEDYVAAMPAILGLDAPGDFIIASGRPRTVADFVAAVFACVGMDWRACVVEDPGLLRRRGPVRVGDPSRLHAATGWRATLDLEGIAARLVATAEEGRPRR